MECDDQAARLTVRTVLRHEQPAVPIGAVGAGPALLRFVETQKLFDPKDIYGDAPSPTRL
jgi:hypothetical protein